MKGLSMHQPWADLIADGRRPLEIRSWAPSYRGPLFIHASLGVDLADCLRFGIPPGAVGAFVGTAELTSVRELSELKWETLRPLHLQEGPLPYGEHTFAWSLKNPRRLPLPILFQGALGIFAVPENILACRTFKVLKNGRIYASLIPGKYAGHREGKIFGRLDCASGMRMKKENRVFFLSWKDAINEGYRPCKNCGPSPDA